MTKYRSRLQIMADILSVANEIARKTHIMYGANLSQKLLNRYLPQVIRAGLVRQNDNGEYKITSKGRLFLERYNSVFERKKSLEKHVNKINGVKERLEELCSATV